MDISGCEAAVHMRRDAYNLVTTASTTHLPEQKETIHMIQMLPTESLSGSIDDLAHVVAHDMIADCPAKIDGIRTGKIPYADKHPPFRELMKVRHKAYRALD